MSSFFKTVGEASATARSAAEDVREKLDIRGSIDAAVYLGTGWGDAFTFEKRVPLEKIVGFKDIPPLAGHARSLAVATISGKQVLVHQGRIHLYERLYDPAIARMVRLQAALNFELNVKHLVLTCAAGGLTDEAKPESLVLVDGFLTLFAPDLPNIGAEFCSAEDAIASPELRSHIEKALRARDIPISTGGYAMVRGSMFEGRKYDKQFLRMAGVSCVGMSVVPEALVADVYNRLFPPSDRVPVTVLAFISNDAIEQHSHEENLERAKKCAAMLGTALATTLAALP